MKIGFLSADWGIANEQEAMGDEKAPRLLMPGGANWYRTYLPAYELERNGYEVVVSEQVAIDASGDGLILCDWKDKQDHLCDIIVMQRVMHDFSLELVEAAHRAGQIIVNDVDDWYWGLHPSNSAYKTTDPREDPNCNRDIYKKVLMASDAVTVSTPFLRDKILSWNPNTHLVRNAIDLDRWRVFPQRENPVVGWVGATSHRSGDLETLKGIVQPYIERHDLAFHHSGWRKGYPHACEMMNVEVERSTTTPMSPIYNYPEAFSHMDISLVPLNTLDFNSAKSAIKGIESAAAGRPFIAQASPEYRWLQETYGIGRVAKKPRQWVSHLEELYPLEVRAEEAARNRELLAPLDIAVKWKDWEEVYGSLL